MDCEYKSGMCPFYNSAHVSFLERAGIGSLPEDYRKNICDNDGRVIGKDNKFSVHCGVKELIRDKKDSFV